LSYGIAKKVSMKKKKKVVLAVGEDEEFIAQDKLLSELKQFLGEIVWGGHEQEPQRNTVGR
jgi:hypothetical protein